MSRVTNKSKTRQQQRHSVKKLKNLTQEELNFIQLKHLEGLQNMSLKRRFSFAVKLIFKRVTD